MLLCYVILYYCAGFDDFVMNALIGDVSYHRYPCHHNDDSFDDDDNDYVVDFHSDCFSYNGIVVDPNERDSLAKDLGPNNKVFL